MVPSASSPRRTSRLDTPMVGSSTRTGGDGRRGGRVEGGAVVAVVALVAVVDGTAGAGAASGRAGGCPHAPRTRASVTDASPAATRRSVAGTPAPQRAGRDAGQQQRGHAGQDHPGWPRRGRSRRRRRPDPLQAQPAPRPLRLTGRGLAGVV